MNNKQKKTQNERVLDFIDTHGSITRMQAFEALGITELPKRISEMRQAGIPIADEWVEVKNRYGEKTRVKAYSRQEAA